MDRKKECLSPRHGDVPNLSGKRLVVGAKQLRRAVASGSAQQVYLASNADPALTEPLEALCTEHGIPYTWVCSMADLGSACGIEVGAAAAAVIN